MLDRANGNPDPIGPYFPAWSDLSLSSGYPGLLLFFSSLKEKDASNGQIWEYAAHQYALKIKEALEEEGCEDLSLYSGICGICFAFQRASSSGQRYQRLLNTLHTILLEGLERKYIEPIRSNISECKPSFAHLYDCIQGLCGIGRYTLELSSNPKFYEMTQAILLILVELCQPLKVNGVDVPGWFTAAEDPLNTHSSQPGKGNFNLGLAHGVTGILAFLAIAAIRGFEVRRQRDMMDYIANWICEKSLNKNGAIQWPYHVSWEQEVEKLDGIGDPSRDAWCYGVPGIARTLFLAGKALNSEKLKQFALTAFRGVFNRNRHQWGLPGPTLCHGIAGLLLITQEMAKEEEGANLVSEIHPLKELLLSSFNPDAPFGFQDSEPCKSGHLVLLNKVGLLEGAAGVLLTLGTSLDHQPSWQLPFLINA